MSGSPFGGPAGNGLVNVGGRNYTPSVDYQFSERVDSTDPRNVYYGKAPAGSAESAAVWQIRKQSYTVALGFVVTQTIAFADSGEFDQVWSNRTSLSYS